MEKMSTAIMQQNRTLAARLAESLKEMNWRVTPCQCKTDRFDHFLRAR